MRSKQLAVRHTCAQMERFVTDQDTMEQVEFFTSQVLNSPESQIALHATMLDMLLHGSGAYSINFHGKNQRLKARFWLTYSPKSDDSQWISVPCSSIQLQTLRPAKPFY